MAAGHIAPPDVLGGPTRLAIVADFARNAGGTMN
jgi:hypothetical protein